jgi:hypothetical protein
MDAAVNHMARVVFKRLNTKTASSKKRISVKRVRKANGAVMVVDVASRTLPDDLKYVFRKNVLQARKDNRRKLGSSDLVPGNA